MICLLELEMSQTSILRYGKLMLLWAKPVLKLGRLMNVADA